MNELDFLEWFYANADFGPADWDIQCMMQKEYEHETGNRVPDSYRILEDGS